MRISVAMITADYPPTTLEISREAGISVESSRPHRKRDRGNGFRSAPRAPETVRALAHVMPKQKLVHDRSL